MWTIMMIGPSDAAQHTWKTWLVVLYATYLLDTMVNTSVYNMWNANDRLTASINEKRSELDKHFLSNWKRFFEFVWDILLQNHHIHLISHHQTVISYGPGKTYLQENTSIIWRLARIVKISFAPREGRPKFWSCPKDDKISLNNISIKTRF